MIARARAAGVCTTDRRGRQGLHAVGLLPHAPEQAAGHADGRCALQGYARLTGVAAKGSTLWGCFHTPQNRELFMLTAGDGSVHLCKYVYPDKR